MRRSGALAMVLALTGCAATVRNPDDPLERFNRSMFTFNDGFDRIALKPAATIYHTTMPSFVQTGIGNFFGNIGDVWTAVNNLLQGRMEEGFTDVMRVAVNTTLGLGGVLDIGSEAGMSKHNEDFGQTLGKWGVKSGPYVVLPLLGSSTVRDSLVLPLDYSADPWGYIYPVRVRNIGSVVRVVDQRAALLDASNLIEAAAFDRYEFVRDAYLQRRQSKITNGESSRKPDGGKAPKDKIKDKSSLNEAPVSPQAGEKEGAGLVASAEPGVHKLVEPASIKPVSPQLQVNEPQFTASPASSDQVVKQ